MTRTLVGTPDPPEPRPLGTLSGASTTWPPHTVTSTGNRTMVSGSCVPILTVVTPTPAAAPLE